MNAYTTIMVMLTCIPLLAMESTAPVRPEEPNTGPVVKIITQKMDLFRDQLAPDGGWIALTDKQLLLLASRYINRTLKHKRWFDPQNKVPSIPISISRESFEDTLAVATDHSLYTKLSAQKQIAVLEALNLLRCTNIREIVPGAKDPEPELFADFSEHTSPKEEES